MPTIEDVDSCVSNILNTLEESVYKIIREQLGLNIYYSIYKNEEYLGTYLISPSEAGLSVQTGSNPEFANEWETIVSQIVHPSLIKRFGELPWKDPNTPPPEIPLLNISCQTQPENICNILEKFCITYDYPPELQGKIEIETMKFGKEIIQYIFAYPRLSVYKFIGHVQVTPINDVESELIIQPYNSIPSYIEGAEGFDRARRLFLKNLAEYLYMLYKRTANLLINSTSVERKPKQKGRYRFTKNDIQYRKTIVKKANAIKKEQPGKLWKEIAFELGVNPKTLRDWRHNPLFS